MGKFIATRGLIALNINGLFYVRSSKGVNENVLGLFPEITVNDISSNNGFSKYLADNKFIAVETISSSNEIIGLVCLGEKLNKIPYTEDDLEFSGQLLTSPLLQFRTQLSLMNLKKLTACSIPVCTA